MRGKVSPKLAPFLLEVNKAIAEAKELNIQLTPEMARANLDKLAAFTTQSPQISYIEDKIIVVNQHSVAVRVYSQHPKQESPTLVYFHGGGHMCGSVNLYDPMCRKLAIATKCNVISVEYRLAPEYPYPAGISDSELVIANYKQALTQVNFNDTVIIGGDSAGGAICTSLAMNSLENSALKIDKQVLIYPSVDYSMSSNSMAENGQGFLLERSRILWYFNNYFLHDECRITASPLSGSITNKLPESLVITAGCDPLRDEGLAYANSLIAAGVKVQHYQFDDMIHAFMNLEDLVIDECQQLYKIIGDFVQQS